MNRRFFLKVLGLGAAVAAVDPEQLLWTPGQRTHILPPAGGWRPTFIGWDYGAEVAEDARYVVVMEDLSLDEFRTRYLQPAIRELFDRAERDMLAVVQQHAKDVAFYQRDQWPPHIRKARLPRSYRDYRRIYEAVSTPGAPPNVVIDLTKDLP